MKKIATVSKTMPNTGNIEIDSLKRKNAIVRYLELGTVGAVLLLIVVAAFNK